MFKLLPSFSYTLLLDSEDSKKSLGLLRERFSDKGAVLIYENELELLLEINASKLANALNFLPDNLKILIQRSDNGSTLKIKVTRSGERKACIAFVCIASAISLAAFIQKQDLQALVMPFIFYALMYFYSTMPIHPAHKVIRKLVRFNDEP